MNAEAPFILDLAIVCVGLALYAVNPIVGMGFVCVAFVCKGALR